MRRFAVLLVVVTVAGGAAACGDDDDGLDDARCLRAEGAQVCLSRTPGGAELGAAGLAPGSELVLESQPGGQSRIPVTEEGTLAGTIGFLGGLPADRADIRVQVVEATTADGENLSGELRLTE